MREGELLEKRRDAMTDAAGGEGGHGVAKPQAVVHRYGLSGLLVHLKQIQIRSFA